MITSTVPGGDMWKITPEAKAKYDDQFFQLKPMNGFITGDQAKHLFLQSGLPPQILAHIWALADRNADGKMDANEFAIAMHLIQMKLKGMEIPKMLPHIQIAASVTVPAGSGFRPPVQMGVGQAGTGVPSAPMGSLATGFMRPASPVDTKLQRSGSVSSQDSPTGIPPPPLIEWAVSQQSKLKFTQLFNSYDRTRTGFLTGAQAKNILVNTGLSQPILAQIWSLSDIDGDGRLSCEEFVLAMHLAECFKAGDPLPRALPPDLIPPSHRRKRSTSVQSTGSASSHGLLGDISLIGDLKDDKLLQQTTFEDKRRENFEKGQAELEKRRLALLESQRKEQEERERKEREEQERRERIRQEQERRRQLELEKQLAKQRELEQEKEEQRRKALEQREAARREMERQRALEWEKQRRQELLTQRQKEQESVCHLKNMNKNLTFELEQLSGKIGELNDKISETRKGVTDMKCSIDNMRTERDTKLNEMNEVKGKIKEMNDRLLILSQEKINLKTQLKDVSQTNPSSDSYNVVMHSFNNKQIILHQLHNSLSNIEKETAQKQKDIENNNSQLKDLKDKLNEVMESHKVLYQEYEERRQKVISMKKSKEGSIEVAEQPPGDRFDDVWGQNNVTATVTESWDAFAVTASDSIANDTVTAVPDIGKVIKYRILYAFEARNVDELSIMPGDVVLVPDGQSSEPGWLGGELHGKKGWFPEAYAELIESSIEAPSEGDVDAFTSSAAALGAPTETVHIVGTEMKRTLEGISEAPENTGEVVDTENAIRDVLQQSENSSFTQLTKTSQVISPINAASPVPGQSQSVPDGIQAQALFPWKAKKENHLSFNKGDVINVKEQQDMWWYGEFQGKPGWFPKSYVKLISGPMRINDSSLENAFNQNDLGEPPEVNTTPPNGSPEYYTSTYAYQSQEPGDLCFQIGDTILVTKKDGEWWTGIMNTKSGIFPSNYVKKIESSDLQSEPATEEVKDNVTCVSEEPIIPESAVLSEAEVKADMYSAAPSFESTKTLKKSEIVTVIAAYQATGPEQLSLERGQLVQVRKKSPSGWWEGEIQVKGKKRQVGWFPASYVKALSGSGASSNRSTPEPILQRHPENITNGGFQLSKPCLTEQVVALYSFVGQQHDELTFQKGEIIAVINKDDPSWWKGEINGAAGLFPSNYVEPLAKSTVPQLNQ